MKDEEMAEEKAKLYSNELANKYHIENRPEYIGGLYEGYCDGFLAGLKAGRPQWHDLRENPNDLPDDTYDVLDQAGYKVHYNFFQNVWVNEKDEIDEHVIAWCEIPTFDKE